MRIWVVNYFKANGCVLMRRLAESPSSHAIPSALLSLAQTAVVEVMGAHRSNGHLQCKACQALTALQPLIRRRLCADVRAARAACPGMVTETVAADALSAIADELV